MSTSTNTTVDSGISPSIQTLISVYNKYLIDLLLVAKRRAPGLKKALKESGHSAIDASSAAHISHASAYLPLETLLAADPTESVKDEKVLSFEPLKGVPFSAISEFSEASSSDEAAAEIDLPTFLYVLATLSTTYSVAASTEEEGARSILVKGVLGRLSLLQGSSSVEDDTENKVVLDDDVSTLLGKLAIAIEDSKVSATATTGGGSNPLEGLMKSLENSKIAGMASEISQELDLSKLGNNPIDALGFDKLGDGNSVLGDIVSKVGSKIQGKLANGELKQEELLSEAVGFLKAFEGFGGGGSSSGGPDLSGLASMLGSLGSLSGAAGGKKGKGGGGGFDASSLMSTMMSAMKASAAAGAHVPKPPTADTVAANERKERMKAKLAAKKNTE
jgi:hypothetical protein